jgi:hypothetical protein
MEQVLLKSQVGPMEITYRPTDTQRFKFVWGFDNDFKCAVPLKWWEERADTVFDRESGKLFRQVFQPLQRITT